MQAPATRASSPRSPRSSSGWRSSRAAWADALFRAVVRRFLRDRDVVHVALAEARGRNPNELRLVLKLRDRRAAAIAHAGAEAADELMDHGGDAAFVRD